MHSSVLVKVIDIVCIRDAIYAIESSIFSWPNVPILYGKSSSRISYSIVFFTTAFLPNTWSTWFHWSKREILFSPNIVLYVTDALILLMSIPATIMRFPYAILSSWSKNLKVLKKLLKKYSSRLYILELSVYFMVLYKAVIFNGFHKLCHKHKWKGICIELRLLIMRVPYYLFNKEEYEGKKVLKENFDLRYAETTLIC